MAKLSATARNRLKDSSFVFPKERSYPIEDKAHARNALSRVGQFGSPDQKAKVRSEVHQKYPSISGQGAGNPARADRAPRKG